MTNTYTVFHIQNKAGHIAYAHLSDRALAERLAADLRCQDNTYFVHAVERCSNCGTVGEHYCPADLCRPGEDDI